MTFKLRDYQQESIDKLYQYFFNGNIGNPLVVLPTGSGKGIVIAKFIELAMQYDGQRILMLTHVKELIEQNHEKLLAVWPEGHFLSGVNSAGMNRRDTEQPVIFAGIQSVRH